MRSYVDYGYKTYGNYIFENFAVDIDYMVTGYVTFYYQPFEWNEGDNIDFDRHSEFSKKLEDILLDQISPVDVKTKTYSWKRTFKRIILKRGTNN